VIDRNIYFVCFRKRSRWIVHPEVFEDPEEASRVAVDILESESAGKYPVVSTIVVEGDPDEMKALTCRMIGLPHDAWMGNGVLGAMKQRILELEERIRNLGLIP